ncbi:MAG: serine protease [Acidobacteria bacterium]|nr:MAG: serine protease [Acidobacteriota bacterium]PYQ79927.1 MAG: serine protease [Acidobacteriota bacterium]PYQ89196.1 MAG: serine protease [Acidobacteriota bacterium]PYR05848.1 MAG: serine protease [Acidobacteriota bacterium]
MRTRSVRVAAVLILSALIRAGAQYTNQSPVVYVAEVDGIIHPVSAEYMTHAIDAADAAHATLIVFILRTPGGLVDSTRAIVSRMISAATPVAVFVAPSGARAASAGFLLIIAADIAAMAPGTHIGAAHPVAGSGEKMDEAVAKKAAEDVAAYARTLAARRRRNVALASEAVMASRAFTEEEALAASPPLVDVVATDTAALLQKLDGRTIARFDGSSARLRTAGARIIPIEMTLRQRVLSAIAHPNVAYILLSLGTLGLTIELWSPGAILPGIVGGLSLLLAFFAFQVLPVNYAGLLLILFGLVLFALEIKVTSFGLLTVGGIVSLVLGSMILIDSPVPELQLSLRVVMPVAIGLTGISLMLIRLGVRAQRQPPVTGAAAMIGESGEVVTEIAPGRPGRVSTHGEIWQAEASEAIPEGSRVRITAIQGLTLTVRRDEVPS